MGQQLRALARLRHYLRLPPDPHHRRGRAHGRRGPQARPRRGRRRPLQARGQGVFRRVLRPHRQARRGRALPEEPRRIRLAAHVVVLDDEGRVKEVYAAHDSGKVVNPTSIQGQIEGGVLMGMGYALTEHFPLEDCVPQAKYGTLGLLHSTQIPDIHAIYVEKDELLPFAYGSKGIGEISAIPTAPAVEGAYYAMDHKFRNTLPLEDTWYSRKH
ncbi:MAG: molybdopterin cofactor-binding domain-containing protein [Oscillospiraceae bacterium]